MLSFLEGRGVVEALLWLAGDMWFFRSNISKGPKGLATSVRGVERQGTGHTDGSGGVLEAAATVGLVAISSSWQWGCVFRAASQAAGSNLSGLVLLCARQLFLEGPRVCFVSPPSDL